MRYILHALAAQQSDTHVGLMNEPVNDGEVALATAQGEL